MKKGYVFSAQIDNRGFNHFTFLGINKKLIGKENIEVYNIDTNEIDWISWKWFAKRMVQILAESVDQYLETETINYRGGEYV
jgi:hypothetical protein